MSQAPSVQSSKEDVWYLKTISFGGGKSAGKRPFKIITQNFNGPCSFIAICNILILRGNIEILPEDRTTASYEFLSQLVADYLVKSCEEVDVSAALTIMPLTQRGMDLNPVFTDSTAFRPAGDGGELKLFEQSGITLIHGWLVDPSSPEYLAISKVPDYDSAVNLIVEADHKANGRLVVSDNYIPDESGASGSGGSGMSQEDASKIEDAIAVRRFLENTRSQLTYHGLFDLASIIKPGSLAALFRSSHLSVIYRPDGDDTSLYTLVTDQSFLTEPSVVWERIEDVDGGWSSFVDADFVRSSPLGGDFVGQTAERALAAFEAETDPFSVIDPADRALAQQLQAEEDAHAQRLYHEHQRRQMAKFEQQQISRRSSEADSEKKKKKKDCVIM